MVDEWNEVKPMRDVYKTKDVIVKKLITSGSGPSSRSLPAAASIKHHVYIFGGVNDDFSRGADIFYNDLHQFDTQSNVWHSIQVQGPTPSPRACIAAVGDKDTNRLFVFGGFHYGIGFKDIATFNDLWAYLPHENVWTLLPPGQHAPCERGGVSMWLDGSMLYVFGGVQSNTEMLNDMWAYDLKNNQWTELIPNKQLGSPPGRYTAYNDVKAWRGKLIMYGGEGDGKKAFGIMDDTWEYDIQSNKWTNITSATHNMIPARNQGAAALIGDFFFAQGGDVDDEERANLGCGAPFPQSPDHEFWQLDLVKNQWSKLQTTGEPLPRIKRTRGVAVKDKMYVFLGYDFQCENDIGPGQIWNHDVFSFTPQFESETNNE
ncbi:MAG: hypothetical protein H0W64_02705 [Gammaproteobacteria bacterium]|nr:hypothetical protein [Gammaproteobacteria bacterium]